MAKRAHHFALPHELRQFYEGPIGLCYIKALLRYRVAKRAHHFALPHELRHLTQASRGLFSGSIEAGSFKALIRLD